MIPGEIIPAAGEILINQGRKSCEVQVTSLGDRPVQVGSHYHFFEVNGCLKFDRDITRGYRLNIPAGTATRFEPGETKTIELIAYQGQR